MDQEKSAIEKLKDFAANSDRQIEYSEDQYPAGSGINPRLFSLSYAIISDKLNQNEYFVSYSDSKRFGDNAMYSGLFFPIEALGASTIKIRKKNILDRLNPFFKGNRFNSPYRKFDSKVVIEENDLPLTNRIFSNQGMQELTLEVLNLDERIMVGVNSIQVDIVPILKGQATFGIYTTGEWLFNESLLEKLFRLTDKIRNEGF